MTSGSSFEEASPPALAPGDAFALLGNESRIQVLRALGAADDPLSFSELRQRARVRDSGQFNYHLEKMIGHFVRRTKNGYVLTSAGEYVIRAVLAGAITERPILEPTELESRCPYCGATAEASYADETFTARCTRCEGVVGGDEIPTGTFMRYNFPPAGLINRTPEEVLAAAHTLYDAKLTAMLDQVCPECAATVAFTFDICHDHQTPSEGLCPSCGSRHKVWITAACSHCRYVRQFILWFVVVTNPAVIAFYHELGVPWTRVPFPKLTWENSHYIRNIAEEVVSDDPLRICVSIPANGAALQATIDEELNVIDVKRRPPG